MEKSPNSELYHAVLCSGKAAHDGWPSHPADNSELYSKIKNVDVILTFVGFIFTEPKKRGKTDAFQTCNPCAALCVYHC